MILELDLPTEEALWVEKAFKEAKYIIFLNVDGKTKTLTLQDDSWRI